MAGGLTAAAVGEGERAGQQVGRNGETAEQFELALAQSGCSRAFGFDRR